MKNILDKSTRDEIIARVYAIHEDCKAQWGKMNAAQMMKHCSQWDEMAQGKKKYKQSFIGKLFGKFGLKDMMQDGPVKKNLPTVPSFKIKETGSFTLEKIKWLDLLQEYEHMPEGGIVHPFFGELTKEQTGIMVYKHIDHHLKQFNC